MGPSRLSEVVERRSSVDKWTTYSREIPLQHAFHSPLASEETECSKSLISTYAPLEAQPMIAFVEGLMPPVRALLLPRSETCYQSTYHSNVPEIHTDEPTRRLDLITKFAAA